MQKGAKIKIKREEIPLLQAIVGFPKYPGLHSQIPLWFLGTHTAFKPQLTREHANTQLPCEHVLSKAQSKSVSHCGLASTKKRKYSACISNQREILH